MGDYMKRILIFFIQIYQKMPLACHSSCRHIPTCSNYAIEALENYGVIKGSFLTIKRIFRCNPWGTCGYDPVPRKETKNETMAKI